MNVRFLTFAQQEINKAFTWFEGRADGQGIAFLDDLDRVVHLVRRYPSASPEIEPEIRRCLFARLPYSPVYGVENDSIVVVAVAHTRREPNYWVDRLG